MMTNKLLAMPALLGISLGGLVGVTPANAAELPTESMTPTFNTASIDIIDQNLSHIVSSDTPSFNKIDLPMERVSVRTAIEESNGAVIVPAANKTNELKIERASLTSKPKPKPKVVKVEEKVETPETTAVNTGVNENRSSNSRASTNAPKATVASASRSTVSSGSSDAMTRDSRNGTAKTYKDNSVALDYDAEGTGMAAVVSAAHAGIGVPYVWGGNTTSGWDCSGYVKWAYAKAGVNIARGTAAIRASGQFVRTTNPQPGDLVFQNGGGHVGIYLGGGEMIGAQNPSVGTVKHNVSRNPLYGYYTLKK